MHYKYHLYGIERRIEESKVIVCRYSQVLLELSSFSIQHAKILEISQPSKMQEKAAGVARWDTGRNPTTADSRSTTQQHRRQLQQQFEMEGNAWWLMRAKCWWSLRRGSRSMKSRMICCSCHRSSSNCKLRRHHPVLNFRPPPMNTTVIIAAAGEGFWTRRDGSTFSCGTNVRAVFVVVLESLGCWARWRLGQSWNPHKVVGYGGGRLGGMSTQA